MKIQKKGYTYKFGSMTFIIASMIHG